MSDENRHPREPSVSRVEPDDQTGFVVSIIDNDPRPDTTSQFVPDDVESAEVQIKPHPMGFQVTCWWTTTTGERKQRDEVVNFLDHRDELEMRQED